MEMTGNMKCRSQEVTAWFLLEYYEVFAICWILDTFFPSKSWKFLHKTVRSSLTLLALLVSFISM